MHRRQLFHTKDTLGFNLQFHVGTSRQMTDPATMSNGTHVFTWYKVDIDIFFA